MADANRAPIESQPGDDTSARRTIGADQRLRESRAIAGETTRQRNVSADDLADAGDQRTAIDVQPVGQHEYAGQIVGEKRAPNRLTARVRA